MATTLLTTSLSDPYLELVQSFPLRPIRSQSVHHQAKAMLRSLAGRRGSAIRDYKTVLVSLIADYERSAHLQLDISKISAAQIVRHLIEEHGTSINALAKILGISQSSLSEMLNGHRGWSKSAIVRICDHFKLEPGLFLR